MRGLQDIADGGVQPELAALAGVAPVDEQLAGRGLIEAADEVCQRRFPGAGFAYDGDVGAEGDVQIEVLEDGLLPVGVAEGHVLKADIAADGLPVLLFGLEAVAVAGDDLLAVAHVGFGIEQLRQALDVHLGGDEVGDRVHQPAHRLHEPLRVGHEHREGADLGFGDDAALPEHDRQRQRGGEVHRHGEEAPQPRRPDALAAHLGRVGHEGLLHRVLHDEGLDRARAGDALVEVAGDLGVHLADLAVGAGELALEEGVEQHRHGQHRDDQQRKARVDNEHDDHRAQHVAELPDAVQQRPGDERADARGVGHDARVDVADAVLVEVGEGQRLQVGEGGVAQILLHADFDGLRAEGRIVVDQGAAEDEREVEHDEERDMLERPLADEAVEGVALEERHAGVHHAAREAAGHQAEQGLFVVFQIGQHLVDAEEAELGILHAVASSPTPDWMAQICA